MHAHATRGTSGPSYMPIQCQQKARRSNARACINLGHTIQKHTTKLYIRKRGRSTCDCVYARTPRPDTCPRSSFRGYSPPPAVGQQDMRDAGAKPLHAGPPGIAAHWGCFSALERHTKRTVNAALYPYGDLSFEVRPQPLCAVQSKIHAHSSHAYRYSSATAFQRMRFAAWHMNRT
jgi:hypothetical protein